MSEENAKHSEEDLSALLDSALADFGRTQNTDDELDSLMAKMDAEAVDKAARNFDELIQRATQSFAASTSAMEAQDSSSTSTHPQPFSADDRKAAENFQKMMKTLIQAEEKAKQSQAMETDSCDVSRAGTEEFMNRIKNLADRDPSVLLEHGNLEPLMELTSTLFAKDFMYPTIKQIHANFLEYLAKHTELDDELQQKYRKQIDVMSRICQVYEKEDSTNTDVMANRTEEICSLIMELQSYGYPPEEVVGSMPAGWSLDQTTGLPLVDDVAKAANACNFM